MQSPYTLLLNADKYSRQSPAYSADSSYSTGSLKYGTGTCSEEFPQQGFSLVEECSQQGDEPEFLQHVVDCPAHLWTLPKLEEKVLDKRFLTYWVVHQSLADELNDQHIIDPTTHNLPVRFLSLEAYNDEIMLLKAEPEKELLFTQNHYRRQRDMPALDVPFVPSLEYIASKKERLEAWSRQVEQRRSERRAKSIKPAQPTTLASTRQPLKLLRQAPKAQFPGWVQFAPRAQVQIATGPTTVRTSVPTPEEKTSPVHLTTTPHLDSTPSNLTESSSRPDSSPSCMYGTPPQATLHPAFGEPPIECVQETPDFD